MWRTSFNLLRNRVVLGSSSAAVGGTVRPRLDGYYVGRSRLITSFCSTAAEVGGVLKKSDDDEKVLVGGGGVGGGGGGGGEGDKISCSEAKRLMRLVNVEALKMKLGMEDKEVIGYEDLLEACKSLGVAKSSDEAASFARVLDEAGIVLLFRDKVYLHPDKVVDLVRKAVPLALLPENHPSNDELKQLQEKMGEIDKLAHKQVRRILWAGLGLSMLHVGLFFRLTFWEFSWDVMEPIAFFSTASGLVIGYAYFLFTSRDPTYQDFMKRLFLSRQKKLMKKYNFDFEKFKELQMKCKSPLDFPAAIKHRVVLGSEHNDLLPGN